LKPSFTLLELVIVIIIIGIIASTIMIPSPVDRLQLATDVVEKYINFTHTLALKDDKYQPFPKNSSDIEQNRSKYWFKQWWQIRFAKTRKSNIYFIEIFSDQPINSGKNFDKVGYTPTSLQNISIAYDGNGKLLIGNCGGNNFPKCNLINNELNLSKYGIKKIYFNGSLITSSNSKRLVFDNFGNLFLDEGDKGDNNDINPLDMNKRVLVTKPIIIKLCLDNNCNNCRELNISVSGNIIQKKCN